MNYGSPAPQRPGQGGRGASRLWVPSFGVTGNTPRGNSSPSGLSLVRLLRLCYPSISELGRKIWFKKTNKHHYKEYFNPLEGICL